MDYDYEQTAFSKCLMAGLATGIIIIPINLLYNFIYRNITSFTLSWVINITSTIFASFIICVIAGLIFYFIVPYLKKSKNLYSLLFIILTIVVIFLGLSFQRSNDPVVSRQFRGLYLGDVIITGIATAFFIPWLARHKNAFF